MFTKTSLLATALLLAAVPAFAEAPVATAPVVSPAASSQAVTKPATPPVTPSVEAKVQPGGTTKLTGTAEHRGDAMKPAHAGKVAGTAATEPGATTRTN
jgi:hypothetical protein